MEKVALNNHQLDYLAQADPKLCQLFYGTVACDRLPTVVNREGPTAYIVNTDPHNKLENIRLPLALRTMCAKS